MVFFCLVLWLLGFGLLVVFVYDGNGNIVKTIDVLVIEPCSGTKNNNFLFTIINPVGVLNGAGSREITLYEYDHYL